MLWWCVPGRCDGRSVPGGCDGRGGAGIRRLSWRRCLVADSLLVRVRGDWRLELGRGGLGATVGIVGVDIFALAHGVVHGVVGHVVGVGYTWREIEIRAIRVVVVVVVVLRFEWS